MEERGKEKYIRIAERDVKMKVKARNREREKETTGEIQRCEERENGKRENGK